MLSPSEEHSLNRAVNAFEQLVEAMVTLMRVQTRATVITANVLEKQLAMLEKDEH